VENFAQKKFAHTGFERELSLLSSSECITATAIVQIAARATRPGITRWARSLEDGQQIVEKVRGQNF
jgi:hypothetical protein